MKGSFKGAATCEGTNKRIVGVNVMSDNDLGVGQFRLVMTSACGLGHYQPELTSAAVIILYITFTWSS